MNKYLNFATVQYLKKIGMKSPVCIGIHAVFSGNAYQDLLNTGAEKVITCNTILHESNRIDVCDLFYFLFELL